VTKPSADDNPDEGATSDAARHEGAGSDGAAQARAAMERAREGARARGASTRSARQSSKDQDRRRRSQAGREPYGQGREPKSVQSEIAALFEEPGWKENLQVAGVTARWRDVVGDAVADHCSEVSFEAGVVRVRASSTAWATQLGTMSGHIRQLLNEAIGSTVVSEVRIAGPTGRTWAKGPWTVRGRGPRDTYG
jgi:predicted nucleic acid-binding Zn ribbon protein